MRADKWGTPTETIRYAAHWLSATQARAAGKTGRCATCAHFVAGPGPWVRTGPFCQSLGLATRKGAWCSHWADAAP